MGSTPNPAANLQHVRPLRPLDFPMSEPEEERLGQSPRHLDLCFLLLELLRRICLPSHAVAADQFVYWNASDARRCLAPDGFVKLNAPDERPDVWKTWERGVPELAIEILSPSDTPESLTFEKKLERYHELGVRELVCFDVDAQPGARLRVWDLIDGDMLERLVTDEQTPCVALSTTGPRFEWIVAAADAEPAALRLRRDGVLVPTPDEHVGALSLERDAAMARVAELEAKLGAGGR